MPIQNLFYYIDHEPPTNPLLMPCPLVTRSSTAALNSG